MMNRPVDRAYGSAPIAMREAAAPSALSAVYTTFAYAHSERAILFCFTGFVKNILADNLVLSFINEIRLPNRFHRHRQYVDEY